MARVRQVMAGPAAAGAGREEAGVTESTAPLTRLPDAARAAVRALLQAELAAAERRARAAGCPPEVLAELFDARRWSAVEDGRDWGYDRVEPAARRWSAVEDGQDRGHDPVDPRRVGECGG
jgi:hypothetical protein